MKLPGTILFVLCWGFSEGVVTITPVNGTTRLVGQNFIFTCATSIGGTDLNFNPPPSNRLILNPPSGESIEFTLISVTPDDNGRVFSCQDTDETEMITLEVLFAPNYTNSTGNQEINKGDAFSLALNLDANPNMGDNFTYTWTKDGVQFTSGSNVAVTATSISIASAVCSDNGLYDVTATNPLGSDSVSFRLAVLCPPIFEAGSSPIMISVTAGQDFTINCRVNESYPLNPTITLTAPGSVPTNVTANPSDVFSRNQAGTYTYLCRADNTRETTDLTYQVTVAMSPTTPSTDPPTTTPSPTSAAPQSFTPSIGLIVGVVVGVLVSLLQLAV